MIRISLKNISIICILSSIFFFCISCGGGSGTIEAVSVPSSSEFLQFVSDSQKMTPEGFAKNWNMEENKNWKWANYKNSGYPVTEGQIVLSWPDNSTAEEIYNSKLINCHRASVLFQRIYGGEGVYLAQAEKNWSHEVLLIFNERYSYLSCSGLTVEWEELTARNKEEAIKELNKIFKK